MIVRETAVADHEAVARLVTAAFGQPDEAQLIEQIRDSPYAVAGLELVAEVDGHIAGHILFSRVQVRDAGSGAETPALALAPMAVDPPSQRRGIGSALVRAGLEKADSQGEGAVIVLGHPSYYPRFGFEPAGPSGIEPPWPDIPGDAFMLRRLTAFDPRCRGVVVYAPPFDAF